MGRLPFVICALALACDDTKKPAGQRAEAVTASAPVTSVAPPSSSHATPTGAPRVLCASEPRAFPTSPSVKVIDADGAQTAARLDLRGNFTWVNFWAAWCGPCKEEIPRLRSWKAKLASQGVRFELALISLDDDERQLARELATQTDPTARKSLWLPDGPLRAAVLGPLKMKSSAALPAHALVDPDGKVRCFVDGAVEDRDFDEVSKLVR